MEIDNINSEMSMFIYNNPYGYRLNVNHPRINELYRRFKAWKGIAPHLPLSGEERKEFETFVLKKITPRKD